MKSTRADAPRKPRASKQAKPLLWLHSGSGQWAKKIKKRVHYFGTDHDEAVAEYLRTKDDLLAGRVPRPADAPDLLTVKALVNAFMTHKKHQTLTGELTQRSYQDYFDSCELLFTHFGKGTAVDHIAPSDLLAYRRKLAETLGPHRLGNEVNRARVVFRFAFETGLTDKPVRFGEFKRPKKVAFRRQRAQQGERMFEPAQLRKLIDKAAPQLKAMILLAVNAGLGNADLGSLPQTAVDLSGRWVTFPRVKTGVARRCWLWQETVEAIKKAVELRPKPKNPEHDALVFLTRCGAPWHVDDGKPQTAITNEFRKLLDDLKLYRAGLSFYTLRHVFQTIADETGDETATRLVMGHSQPGMADTYRERFPDARLQRVAQHVHDWLFGAEAGKDGDA